MSVYFVFYKRPRNHSQMRVGSRIRSSRLNQITKLTKRERDRGDPPRVCSLNRGGSLQVPAPLDAEPRVTHPYAIPQNVPRNWMKQKTPPDSPDPDPLLAGERIERAVERKRYRRRDSQWPPTRRNIRTFSVCTDPTTVTVFS